MARSKPYTRSMAGGIVSPSMVGRIDDANRDSGLAECDNMLILPEGIATSRPGTRYVRETKISARRSRMIPFRYSSTQTTALEFGHAYIRFHTYGATLLSSDSSSAWAAVPTYAQGELVTYGGHTWYAVTAVPANKQPDLFEYAAGSPEVTASWVHTSASSSTAPVGYTYVGTELPADVTIGQLVYIKVVTTSEVDPEDPESGVPVRTITYEGYTGTAGAAPSSGYWYDQGLTPAPGVDTPYEVPSPYDETHLFELHYVQSGDVLTIVHPQYAPRELRRTSATNWALTVIPFGSTLAAPTISAVTPTTATTPSDLQDYSYVATTVSEDQLDESVASAAVTASNQIFDTGALNTITFGSAGRRNVYRLSGGLYGFIGQTTTTTLIDDNIAPDVSKTPPTNQDPYATDWPGAVSYWGQRRVFGGTPLLGQTINMTKTGTESNFDYSIPTRDNDAISIKIAAREAATIRHIVPLDGLVILTSSGEFSLVSDGPVTPTSVGRPPTAGYIGANNVQPVVVDDDLIYVAARGGHLRGLGYSFERSRNISVDLSVRAPHLFDFRTISDMCYTRSPTPIVWNVSSIGQLIGMTYVPAEEVKAFHTHSTRGYFESVCSVAEGDEDIVYAIVQRTINGADVRYVECFSERFYTDPEDAFFVDCGLTYDGAEATTITGLTHLIGETVNILADGAVATPAVVSAAGEITLETAASKVQVGLLLRRAVRTLPVAVEDVEGFGQGAEKTITGLNVRVLESGAWFAGSDLTSLRETPARSTENWGSPPDLSNGYTDVNIDDNWNPEGQVYIVATDPTPLTLASFTKEVEFGG